MPEFEDLLNRHQADVSKAGEVFGRTEQTEIPRDPLRRPWHTDFVEKPEGVRRDDESRELPWYLTFAGLNQAVRRQWKMGLLGALIMAAALGVAASHITPTYNSTLHLYAPDKLDSIITRLSHLTAQIDYASLPTEFHVPISLMSRRLREDDARHWVVEQLLKDENLKSAGARVNPQTVRVETVYAAGSELLVIQGFADDPQVAAKTTEYFWKRLESELEQVRRAYYARIENWIRIRADALNEQIAQMTQTLGTSAAKYAGGASAPVQTRLNTELADIEVKRVEAQRQIQDLGANLNVQSLDDLRPVMDAEINQMLAIRQSILERDDGLYAGRVSELEQEIKATLNRKYQEAQENLIKWNQDRSRTVGQLDGYRARDGREMMESELARDKRARLVQLESQRADLDKLSGQIALENKVGSMTFKAVQLPIPDPGTLRPHPGMLALVSILGVVVAGLLSAVAAHWLFLPARPVTRAAASL